MCEDMGECRYVRTWEDTDVSTWENVHVSVHGRLQVCEDMRGYRWLRTWEDIHVSEHGRLQM